MPAPKDLRPFDIERNDETLAEKLEKRSLVIRYCEAVKRQVEEYLNKDGLTAIQWANASKSYVRATQDLNRVKRGDKWREFYGVALNASKIHKF